MAQTLLSTVTSGSKPQSGQKNRSSGNFTTEGAPSGTTNLLWRVVPLDNTVAASAISFKVMEDRSAATDPVIFSGVKDNTTTDYKSSRSFYIANPSGSGPSGFNVLVYAVT